MIVRILFPLLLLYGVIFLCLKGAGKRDFKGSVFNDPRGTRFMVKTALFSGLLEVILLAGFGIAGAVLSIGQAWLFFVSALIVLAALALFIFLTTVFVGILRQSLARPV